MGARSFGFLQKEGAYGFLARTLWWSLILRVGESMRLAIFLALRLNIASKKYEKTYLIFSLVSHLLLKLVWRYDQMKFKLLDLWEWEKWNWWNLYDNSNFDFFGDNDLPLASPNPQLGFFLDSLGASRKTHRFEVSFLINDTGWRYWYIRFLLPERNWPSISCSSSHFEGEVSSSKSSSAKVTSLAGLFLFLEPDLLITSCRKLKSRSLSTCFDFCLWRGWEMC